MVTMLWRRLGRAQCKILQFYFLILFVTCSQAINRKKNKPNNSLRSMAIFNRGNRDNKPQSREEPGRETAEKPPARIAGIFC